MSKNRYTNYQKMSDNVEPKTVPNPVEAVKEPAVEPEVVTEPVKDVMEEATVEVVAAPAKTESKVGVVTDCDRLRVRKTPAVSGSVICTIEKGAAVVIDDADSTAEFYKVCTEAGVEGYCMKKFITVKS